MTFEITVRWPTWTEAAIGAGLAVGTFAAVLGVHYFFFGGRDAAPEIETTTLPGGEHYLTTFGGRKTAPGVETTTLPAAEFDELVRNIAQQAMEAKSA